MVWVWFPRLKNFILIEIILNSEKKSYLIFMGQAVSTDNTVMGKDVWDKLYKLKAQKRNKLYGTSCIN